MDPTHVCPDCGQLQSITDLLPWPPGNPNAQPSCFQCNCPQSRMVEAAPAVLAAWKLGGRAAALVALQAATASSPSG